MELAPPNWDGYPLKLCAELAVLPTGSRSDEAGQPDDGRERPGFQRHESFSLADVVAD
jgi:hypothetical protein